MTGAERSIKVPPGTKMVVFIGEDGKESKIKTDVQYPDGTEADKGWAEPPITPIELSGYGVCLYTAGKGTKTCVTYQTPYGPRTV